MTASRRLSWLAATAIGVLAASADLAGWWQWRQWAAAVDSDPAAFAVRVVEHRLHQLPAAAQRLRVLPLASLAGLPSPLVADTLHILGGLQQGWTPADSAGPALGARAAMVRGDLERAAALMDAAVARNPTGPRLRRLRALVSLARGATEPALRDLAAAAALAPGLRSPPVALTDEQELQVRLRGLELRVEYYPRRKIEHLVTLAGTVRREGDDPEAAGELLAAFAGHPLVQLEKASWALEDGSPGRALDALRPITTGRLTPRALKARAWALAAVAHERLGQSDAALDAAHRALQADPGAPQPYVALARLAEERGDLEGALHHLRRAWGVAPSDIGILLNLARVAQRGGRRADAIAALERAMELAPDNSGIAARLVMVQLESGQLTDAALTLSRALDRHPTEPSLLRLSEDLRRRVEGP